MSTKADRSHVLSILRRSPQSLDSLAAGTAPALSADATREALADLITDDQVEEYEDGHDSNGTPITMYREVTEK